MSEHEVMKLFTCEDNDIYFPKLRPETVALLSKTIASVLYSRSSNVCLKATRQDILLLLQKWCSKDLSSHCGITLDNYDCYISCLQSLNKQQNIEYKGNKNVSETIEIVASVSAHCSIIEECNAKKQSLLDIITMRDGMKLGNTMFETNVSERVLSNLSILEDLNKAEGCIPNKEIATVKATIDPNINKNKIKFLYALLNLDSVDECSLLNGLKEMNTNENLCDYEIEFIEHLWKKSEKYNISDATISVLLLQHSVLYEKPLIQMCTDVILGNFVNVDRYNLDSILRVAMKHRSIRCSIISLLYELYASSGYNEKLNQVFDLFNNNYTT